MRNADVLKTLIDHQQRILAHMTAAGPLIGADASPDAATMACRRWQLARMLREYQMFKHRVVFDPAIAGNDPTLREEAIRLKARCIAMGETFRLHALEWSGGAAAERWSDYIRAVRTLIAALRLHIAREGSAMATLIAHPRWDEARSNRAA